MKLAAWEDLDWRLITQKERREQMGKDPGKKTAPGHMTRHMAPPAQTIVWLQSSHTKAPGLSFLWLQGQAAAVDPVPVPDPPLLRSIPGRDKYKS